MLLKCLEEASVVAVVTGFLVEATSVEARRAVAMVEVVITSVQHIHSAAMRFFVVNNIMTSPTMGVCHFSAVECHKLSGCGTALMTAQLRIRSGLRLMALSAIRAPQS